MNKKLIAKLLALALVLAMVPATFLAANAVDTDVPSGSDSTTTTPPASEPPENPDGGNGDVDDTTSNPGGSVTTPVEDTRPVVSTSTTVDEDDVTVENGSATIEATVSSNGTATVSLTAKAVENLGDLVSNGEIVLTIKDDGAKKLNVSFPAEALTSLAEETGADLTIKSTVATITIPNDVLTNEFGTTGTVRISVQSSDTGVSFSIQAGSQALKGIKGIKVEF